MSFETECLMALQVHPRSLILGPIESMYATSYWSSIVYLGPILPRFRDIAGFLRSATPPLFHTNFRGLPLGLDCWCCGSKERRPWANYSCNYFRTQHIRPRYHNVTGRLTDRQMDGRTTYNSNTALALRASGGKNVEERMGTLLWTVNLHFLSPRSLQTTSYADCILYAVIFTVRCT